MNLPFYRAFEEKYYAPRGYILELRRQYLPYVAAIKGACHPCKAFDLGCGRGEWLQLMGEIGVPAKGVDLDEGMLKDCRDLHLDAKLGEAVAALKDLPGESHLVVSAFHVVEHIPFEDLKTLVRESLRVLVPGGILIMETPNPENILVGSKNFYLDPTHERPLPSELLSFVPEYYGFLQTKVLRLQESKTLMGKVDIGFGDVIRGASPDYAVIAQKSGPEEMVAPLRELLSEDRGLSFDQLAAAYDAATTRRINTVASQVQQLRQETAQATQQAVDVMESAERSIQAAAAFDKALTKRMEHVLGELAALQRMIEEAHNSASLNAARLAAVYQSTSWRVTAPLRRCTDIGRRLLSAVRQRRVMTGIKRHARPHVVRAVQWALHRPAFARAAILLLNRVPAVKRRLQAMTLPQAAISPRPVDLARLSPQVADMFVTLRNARDSARQ